MVGANVGPDVVGLRVVGANVGISVGDAVGAKVLFKTHQLNDAAVALCSADDSFTEITVDSFTFTTVEGDSILIG